METQDSTLFVEMNFVAAWCTISVLLLAARAALLWPVCSPEPDCLAHQLEKRMGQGPDWALPRRMTWVITFCHMTLQCIGRNVPKRVIEKHQCYCTGQWWDPLYNIKCRNAHQPIVDVARGSMDDVGLLHRKKLKELSVFPQLKQARGGHLLHYWRLCVSPAPNVLNFTSFRSLKLNLINVILAKGKTKTLAPVIGTTAVYSKSWVHSIWHRRRHQEYSHSHSPLLMEEEQREDSPLKGMSW